MHARDPILPRFPHFMITKARVKIQLDQISGFWVKMEQTDKQSEKQTKIAYYYIDSLNKKIPQG